MIKNIKTSFLAVFPSLVSSLLMVLIAVYTFTSFKQLYANNQRLVNNTALSQVFTDMRQEFFQLRLASISDNPQEVNEHLDVIHTLLQKMSTYKMRYLNKKTDDVAQLVPSIEQYMRLYRQDSAQAKQQNTYLIVSKERHALGVDISHKMTNIVTIITERNHGVGDETASAISNMQLTMTGLIALAIILSITAAFVTSKKLVDTVNLIKSVMEKLAQGQLTDKVRIRGSNELYSLAEDLDRVIDYLRRMMSEIRDASEHISEQVNQLTEQSQANSLAIEAHKVETDQVVAAMTEMSATAHNVADHASSSAQFTQQANEQAERSRQAVEHASNTVNALVSEVENTAATIEDMNLQSQQIASILNVIGGIAEQTNLLALNAAIEAARAGEQGRGFAVVADEVRALAARTQSSTSEINTMLDKLRNGAESAVAAMDQTRKSCQDTAETTLAVTSNLSQLNQYVFDIDGVSNQIATAAGQQSTVAEEINHNLVTIQEKVDELSQSGNATHATAESLSTTREQLTAVVGHFKF
ncbi:hypothetical protein NFHSH190041_04330 [Shewanella sp. NFH-SH190041]|uniref:methyl-accepting chemotaxis protein n=1 Tax=Shewanella sp. NFH-SH190041 TaxID=2950245 RepID=UPI0021C3211B|nr:methyl-accepting chemotaxis protein [Shewanella sp. NFH-SH190041]BDM62981.1 hypothetical protein NFHSH190041_04330 [Shewanella sp. NFH-SH190041]